MRNGYRPPNNHEAEESAFISMTDLTVSVLFIVMILLAFFASQINDKDQVPRADFDRVVRERDDARLKLDDVTKERDRLLEVINILKPALNKARDELAIERQEVDRLSEENNRLELEFSVLFDEHQRTKREIEELRREIEILRARTLQAYLAAISQARQHFLVELRRRITLEFPDLEIEISTDQDALRFKGQALFDSGQSKIVPSKESRIKRVAEILDAMLPCYTFGELANPSDACNPYFAAIEAVQIEGHTDAEAEDLFNLRLSADRAVETLRVMSDHVKSLTWHKNISDQPVISAAAYGEWRPVADNLTREGRDANRRIDLRIIMTRPVSEEEATSIRNRLTGDALKPLR